MTNVYRRGAVYWWRRSVSLDAVAPRSIMFRLSLKSSDKAEAKRWAAALELELQMVAISIPKKPGRPSSEQLQAVFKEALEHKRDHIAAIQSRPPFDDDRHRLANRANAKLFSFLAHTVSLGRHRQWDAVLSEPALDVEEAELLIHLAAEYDLLPHSDSDWARLQGSLKSFGAIGIEHGTAPIGRPAIAPRYVANMMENAKTEDTPENRKTVLAMVAAAYRAACVQANEALGEIDAEARGGELPNSLLALLGEAPAPSPNARHEVRSEEREEFGKPSPGGPSEGVGSNEYPAATADPSELPDLRMSEVCRLAVEENVRAGDWNESAQRNANVIAGIFIAENGDLRMSEIERRHVLAVDARLKTMPTIWGKCREDRQGG